MKREINKVLWKLSGNKFLGKFNSLRSYRQRETAHMETLGQEYLDASQQEYGERLSRSLGDAASKNNVYNVMPDGTKCRSTATYYKERAPLGPVTCWPIPKNGQTFSVIVGIPDNTTRTGYWFVAQALVDMAKPGKELYAYTSVYPREEDTIRLPITEFPEFVRHLSKHVTDYRLFPGSRELAAQ